jgi:hypothetical protein
VNECKPLPLLHASAILVYPPRKARLQIILARFWFQPQGALGPASFYRRYGACSLCLDDELQLRSAPYSSRSGAQAPLSSIFVDVAPR